MQIRPQEILDMLKQTPLFAHLQPEDLIPLARKVGVQMFRNGESIFTVGDPAEAMYVLFDGQVALDILSNQRESYTSHLKRGDFFGEEALLFDDPRYYQAVAMTDCILLSLTVEDYLALWDHLPGVEQRLEILIQSREMASQQSVSWLQDDEYVHVMTRRHRAVLWGKLALPFLTALILMLVSLLLQTLWLPDRSVGWLLLGVGMPLSIFWLVWRVVDWRNDYVIVTNKRVVWLEKVALVYESRQEAPLPTIMSVGLQRSRLGAILRFADVVVTTFVGTIRLRDLAQAETIAGLIESFWQRAKSHDLREESRIMEQVLAEKLAPPQDRPNSAWPDQTRQGANPEQEELSEPGFFSWLFSDFIRLRYETDGAIIYRKHWFILVEKTWLPLLLMLAGLGILAARLGGRLDFVPLTAGVIGMLVLLFAGFIWMTYQYADWRNDVFKVTLDQIIDLDRKPLGKIRRRSAPLENVLSIEYQRKGFWGFLFNFGTVYIVVGNMRLTFDHVYNPSEVQQDIFYRMGERMEHLRQFEIDSERERVSEWIASYHRKTRQAEGRRGGFPAE